MTISNNNQTKIQNSNSNLDLPFEDLGNGKMRIIDCIIPKNQTRLPRVPSKMDWFCIDTKTLKTIHKIAQAVELRQPLLLEGETSTSKTASIMYLASISNQEVARINMDDPDISSLIGGYVPNPDKNSNQPFVWHDGLIVEALEKGYWLILDELNLMPADVIEVINPLLENNTTLTIAKRGETFKRVSREEEKEIKEGKLKGIRAIHPNFRVFATMNPAEYAGRNPLSPAGKNRWVNQLFIKEIDEKAYADMAILQTLGIQPEISYKGSKYRAPKVPSFLPNMANLTGVETLSVTLAQIHFLFETFAKEGKIGMDNIEAYCFTRRDLLATLEFINIKIGNLKLQGKAIEPLLGIIVKNSLENYYFDKLKSESDRREMIVALLKTLEIDFENGFIKMIDDIIDWKQELIRMKLAKVIKTIQKKYGEIESNKTIYHSDNFLFTQLETNEEELRMAFPEAASYKDKLRFEELLKAENVKKYNGMEDLKTGGFDEVCPVLFSFNDKRVLSFKIPA